MNCGPEARMPEFHARRLRHLRVLARTRHVRHFPHWHRGFDITAPESPTRPGGMSG